MLPLKRCLSSSSITLPFLAVSGLGIFVGGISHRHPNKFDGNLSVVIRQALWNHMRKTSHLSNAFRNTQTNESWAAQRHPAQQGAHFQAPCGSQISLPKKRCYSCRALPGKTPHRPHTSDLCSFSTRAMCNRLRAWFSNVPRGCIAGQRIHQNICKLPGELQGTQKSLAKWGSDVSGPQAGEDLVLPSLHNCKHQKKK